MAIEKNSVNNLRFSHDALKKRACEKNSVNIKDFTRCPEKAGK